MPSQIIVQSGVVTFQTVFTNAFQRVLTVPFAHMLLSRVHINNTNSKAATIRVCYVHPSAKPNLNNAVLWDLNIFGNNWVQFGDGEILDRDWSIQIMSTMASAQTKSTDNIEVTGKDPSTDPNIVEPAIINFFLSAYALQDVTQP